MKKAGMIALATLGALAVGVTQASALGTIDVKAAKDEDGPFEDVPGGLTIPVGKEKTLYWKVKNLLGADAKLTFDDAATGDQDTSGFNIKWFKGKKNISSEVKSSGGYEFKLKADKKKIFTAVVKHKSSGSDGFCLGGQAGPPYDAAYFAVNGPCL